MKPAQYALVVEDDPPTRCVLEMLCGHAGLEVVGTADGESAIRALRAAQFDVVILDLSLSPVSGLDVLWYLNDHHPGLLRHTIVTTVASEGMTADISALRSVRCVHRKPIDLHGLFDQLLLCSSAARFHWHEVS